MSIYQAIISQVTPSIIPSSLGYTPMLVGTKDAVCICTGVSVRQSQQTALPIAASTPFKYTEESRRK